jgi:outer membrane protein assembly factor BamB
MDPQRTCPRSLIRALTALAIAPALASPLSAADNWPTFQNGGRVSFPDESAAGELKLAWTADLPGIGQSSPIVWNGQACVTSVSGDNKETYHVSAWRVADGGKLWQHDLANASPQENSGYVSKAAPTPAADEHGVIAFFEGGNVVALTHEGELRWERNLVEDYGPIDARHGLGASVEQTPEAAFVWVERQTEPYILALDKQSGETIWKQPGLGTTSWASPRLVPVAAGQHLVLSGIGQLAGLDPDTGARLWSFREIAGNSTPTPVPVAPGRFLIGATVGRESAGGEGSAAASNGLIAIEHHDGAWTARYVWKATRATSSFGSPIAHAGRAYFVNRTGVLYCLDAETGDEKYAERSGGSIWATPIAHGGQLWLFGKDGLVQSIAPGDEFHPLSELMLPGVAGPSQEQPAAASQPAAPGPPSASDSTLYAGVAVDGAILIRTGNKLHCFRP